LSTATTGKKQDAGKKALKIIAIILASILGLAILAALFGLIYEKATEAKEAKAYPSSGKLYEVGQVKLNLNSYGEAKSGGPIVVIETGLGDPAAAWAKVASLVAPRARILTYDRAGLGYSAPDKEKRDAKRIATQLHGLLAAAGVEGPIVLVGHSIGGIYAREYYKLFPESIEALVLIESSHPDMLERMPPEISKMQDEQLGSLGQVATAARFGLLRTQKPEAQGIVAPDGLTELEKKGFVARALLPASFEESVAEYKAIKDSLAQAKEVTSLGALPLVVLSNGLGQVDLSALPPSVPKAAFEAMNASWKEMQDQTAALSTKSIHLVAEKSHHNVQLEEPEAAAKAIEAALDILAGKKTK
jgi:pimeloyl-ACP methyl ester carboxylesterase